MATTQTPPTPNPEPQREQPASGTTVNANPSPTTPGSSTVNKSGVASGAEDVAGDAEQLGSDVKSDYEAHRADVGKFYADLKQEGHSIADQIHQADTLFKAKELGAKLKAWIEKIFESQPPQPPAVPSK